MIRKCTGIFVLLAFLAPILSYAQDNSGRSDKEKNGQAGGPDEVVKELQGDVSKLKKLKVSGYIQVNWEKSEKEKGFVEDPYDAEDYIKSRFRLRRGRVKVSYNAGPTLFVLQSDFTNAGYKLKDAYLQLREPWTDNFLIRFGVFQRPVFEVEYSSSIRESPERARVITTLYPDERDLGAMLMFEPGNLFSLQLAMFNSTFLGTYKQNNPNFSEYPYYFMARLRKEFDLGDLDLDFGIHTRFGTVRANSTRVIESDSPTSGSGVVVDSTSTRIADGIGRNWFGVEAQLYSDFLGGMKLLGEYIMGSDVDELGAAGSSTARKRDFSGFYLMLVKNIGTDFQFAAKYDSYNPNTAISEDKINSTSELAVSTLGVGLHNYTFENVRLTLWYDLNMTRTNDRILADDPRDNLLTFRAQYKF